MLNTIPKMRQGKALIALDAYLLVRLNCCGKDLMLGIDWGGSKLWRSPNAAQEQANGHSVHLERRVEQHDLPGGIRHSRD